MVKEWDGLMARIKMLESAQEAGMASAKKINETDRERYAVDRSDVVQALPVHGEGEGIYNVAACARSKSKDDEGGKRV